jgi:hypothetical protein
MWRQDTDEDLSIEEISRRAMALKNKHTEQEVTYNPKKRCAFPLLSKSLLFCGQLNQNIK